MTKQEKFNILTTSKNRKYARAQFELALLCAEITIEKDTPKEVVQFFDLVAFLRISKNFGSIEGFKKCDEYSAADWLAYRSADWSTDSAAFWSVYWLSDSAADRAAHLSVDWSVDWSVGIEAQRNIAEYVWKKWEL